jgi:SAM-dependent methyltransferase
MTRDRGCGRCFARDYEVGRAVVVREIERGVLGSDYGATSWTTRDEANKLVDLLRLGPGVRLLDVGAGAGWPGLYLALTSRCDVVLTDVPVSGLRVALERAAQDGIGERCRIAAANGTALPFTAGSFAAISHCDVLCCLPGKLSMLRECRRVTREGGRMAFSVIAPASGLTEGERRRAIETGPEFVDVDGDYATLLAESNWNVFERIDVTETFAQSLRTSLHLMDANAEALIEACGPDDYRNRVDRRTATLMGLEERVLKREVFASIAAPIRLGAMPPV